MCLLYKPFVAFNCIIVYLAGSFLSAPARTEDVPVPTDDKAWVDSSHDYVSDRAQALVEWMDDFYGSEVSDIETAHSRLRLRLETRWDEEDDLEFKVKIRAKVQMPKVSKRAALVFEGDDGDDFVAPGVADDETNVGIQFSLFDDNDDTLRWDLIGTVNSSLDLRTGVRMRYNGSFREGFTTRWVQDFAYQTGDRGAFTKTNLDFFQLINEHNQLALINRVEYGEDTYGVEWSTSLQWRKRLAETEALTYFVGMDGVTDPDYLTENYGLGFSYRRNIYRDYLSVDIEPSHWWRKLDDWDSRRSVWAIMVRFEIRFEKINKRAAEGTR